MPIFSPRVHLGLAFHRPASGDETRPAASSPRNTTPRNGTPRNTTPINPGSGAASRNTTPLSRTPPISPGHHRQVVRTAVVATETLALGTEAVEGVVVQDPHDEALKKLDVKWQRYYPIAAGVYIEKKLADGAWSAIYSVSDHQLNQKFALKATPMVGALSENASFQIATLRSLQHPNILTIHDTFVNKVVRTKFLCMKMDYCKKGSLREFVEKKKHGEVPAARICDFLLQIASALAYIHEKGLLHGDLRLDNILRTSSDQMKLTNFATTSVVPHHADAALTITGGQQMYAPPEWATSTFTRRPLQSFEIPEASYDMWSFGCIVSELVTLRPIKGDRVPQHDALASNEAALNGVLQNLDTAHQGAFSAIGRQLLAVDPDERMTAPQAQAALEALLPHLPASHSNHHSHLSITGLLSVLSART
eukprot:EG_transcript_9424